jgi:hypothetical protein
LKKTSVECFLDMIWTSGGNMKSILKKTSLFALLLSTPWMFVACFGDDDDDEGASGEMDRGDWDKATSSDADSDSDMDADADADWGQGAELDDGAPPEIEEQADYKVPQAAGKYVFIVDETRGSVVVVDSGTLQIRQQKVGSRPSQLVTLDNTAEPTVAVICLGSDEVDIVRVAADGTMRTQDLPVRPDTNALSASPDGRFLVAYHDPQFTAQSGVPSTDQEITVLSVAEGAEKSVHLSVGMHPWKVAFDKDATGKTSRAFVVTEEGINIIDLTDLDNIGIPDVAVVYEGGTYDSTTADIELLPDGSLALARKTGETRLVVMDMSKQPHERREYELDAEPTDLDVAPDGSFGVMVFRTTSEVAFFDLPLPAPTTGGMEADAGVSDGGVSDGGVPIHDTRDGITYHQLTDKVVGVATLLPESRNVLLHTTTGGKAVDQRRLVYFAKGQTGYEAKSVVLERKIHSVAAGVDGATAVVLHQPVSESDEQHPFSYSLVEIAGMQVKFQQTPVQHKQLMLTPDGDFGFFLLEEAKRTEIINLRTFIVDQLNHGSPPTAAGYAVDTRKGFINQDHSAGRMTFLNIEDKSVKTVTGFNLNDDIEY